MESTFPLRTFSLRSLIVVMTLCGIGLAIYVSPWAEDRRQLRLLEIVEELAGREPGMWSITRNCDNFGSACLWLSRDQGQVSKELVQAIIRAKLITSVLLLEDFPDAESKRSWEQIFHYDLAPTWTRRHSLMGSSQAANAGTVDVPAGTNMF